MGGGAKRFTRKAAGWLRAPAGNREGVAGCPKRLPRYLGRQLAALNDGWWTSIKLAYMSFGCARQDPLARYWVSGVERWGPLVLALKKLRPTPTRSTNRP